jgi:hypothetical protein
MFTIQYLLNDHTFRWVSTNDRDRAVRFARRMCGRVTTEVFGTEVEVPVA